MNAGLSSLATLKKHLLGEAIRASTEFDDVIKDIGLGAAELCENHCNRKFAYVVGEQQIISGDREHYYLPRFPLVSVASVETRYQQNDVWTLQPDQPFQINLQSGLVEFLANISPRPGQIRITWTGGYWYDTTEDNTGVQPNSSTALPAALKLAWLTQCRAMWQAVDRLGTDLADKKADNTALNALELLPAVKSMLNAFIRYQLT